MNLRLSISMPISMLPLLASLLLPAMVRAADPPTCGSVCTSARQECRANAPRVAERGPGLRLGDEEPNHWSLGLHSTPMPPPPSRERAENASRRAESAGVCETVYAGCMRDCGVPVPASGVSDVLTRQGQARAVRQ
jgi:hypothetical protein